MDKLLIYSGYDQAGPHIFPVDMGGTNRHIKLATDIHPTVARYMADAKKIPGKTQLLIDAMGASEWWGQNRNGDIFPESQLNHHGDDYGYRTFSRYAHPFKHHVNKDVAKAYGDRVTVSVYHPEMHRVQLIVAVHDSKCQDILRRVDNGDFPDVSMGCRVPYDQCTICGNRAKNRSQYCDDLKYRMGKILPDGRQVGAVNHKPKFFDISFVLIGAEKASHVLAKVASERNALLSRPSAELGELKYGGGRWKGAEFKNATETKKSSIDKKVPLDVKSIKPVCEGAPAVKRLEPKLPSQCVDSLARFPMSDIFSTLAFLGIDPKPEEVQKIILIKAGQEKLAHRLEQDRVVFDETAADKPLDHGPALGVEYVNEKVANVLRPYLKDRSCFTPYLLERLDKYASDPSDAAIPSSEVSLSRTIPMAAMLAGLYGYLKLKSPSMATTKWGTALERHPWLLPLLAAGGAGAAASGVHLLRPMPMNPDAQFDTKLASVYDSLHKTASKKLLIPLMLAPMAYMYSGVQRNRARRGERLNKFDRFIAQRPDLAAIATLAAGPAAISKGSKMSRSLKRMMKVGSMHADFGAFALTSGSKLLPAAVIGAMVDATIAKKIGKILEKRRDHANAR